MSCTSRNDVSNASAGWPDPTAGALFEKRWHYVLFWSYWAAAFAALPGACVYRAVRLWLVTP